MSTAARAVHGLWTSESVTEGHPDKVCDQISDAVLDACLAEDPLSHVACETAVSSDLVIVFGEITTEANLDVEHIVRETLRRIGYTDRSMGIDAETCKVLLSINKQSPDIEGGVRDRRRLSGEELFAKQGAGDQGMMFGYACNETDSLMPMTIELAHNLTRGLAEVRRRGEYDWLLPDGKAQVTIEYDDGRAARIDTIVVSTQHKERVADEECVTNEEIEAGIRRQLISNAGLIPQALLNAQTNVLVNPSGRFVTGGPLADAGLTGRKIIVDTYGGMARHGGGAFSGKDPSKVDRSGAYAARHVARNLVAAELADRVELQISYAIGKPEPTSLAIESFGTGKLSDEDLTEIVTRCFDLRPAAIIEHLGLKRPIYSQVAAYGHFGRSDLDLPWEQNDKVEALREAAGLD